MNSSVLPKKTRKTQEVHENHERWLVSYADFITLMFAFFVVLYATSQADSEKLKQFENSMKKFMMGMAMESSSGGTGEATPPKGKPVNDQEKFDSPIEEKLDRYKSGEAGELLKNVETYIETNIRSQDVEKYIKDMDLTDWGVKIVLDSDALFAGDSEKFQREALNTLDTVLEYVSKISKKTIVASHSDNGLLRSPDFKSFWELTSARATTLTRYLIKRHGMDPSKIVPIGFADQRPLVPNTTPINRKRNRRIEIVVTTTDVDL